MAHRIVKKPVGILYDILIKVEDFIFRADFMIHYCEVDVEVPINLERLFLATEWVLVDIELGQVKFILGNNGVIFNICQYMQNIDDFKVVFVTESIDKV